MTDLDRLLELQRLVTIETHCWTDEEDAEFQSLKSQLGSKLADGDKFQASLQFIPKNSDGHATVECIFCKRGHHEDCLGAPQNCCCGFWDNKVETPEQQIQSQHTNLKESHLKLAEKYSKLEMEHTNLVKAIQEIFDFDKRRIASGHGYKVDLKEQLRAIQNLLESTKEKANAD